MLDNPSNIALAQPPAEVSRALTPPPAMHSQLLDVERSVREEDEEGIHIRDLWRVLVKRRWTILAFFLIVLGAVIFATFLETPLYQASLTLQIKHQVPEVVDLKNPAQMEAMYASYYDFYQTQYELLKSRSLAEQVSKQLNRQPLPAAPERPPLRQLINEWLARLLGHFGETEPADARERFSLSAGAVAVDPIPNSSLVRLSYISPNPALAALVVNSWAQTFMDLNMEHRFGATHQARKFLQEQLQEMRVKLEESERALATFTDHEQIINIDDRKSLLSDRLQSINNALSIAEQDRIKAETLYRQARNGKNEGLRWVQDSAVIQDLKKKKTELEAEYQEKLKVFKPGYPAMQQLASQIGELDNKIRQESGNIRDMLKSDFDAAKTREDMLRAQLTGAKDEFMALQTRTAHQYNLLKRDVDTNRQLYDSLLQRFKELGVADGMESNNVSIIDSALVPGQPFKPDLQKNMLMAVLLGLFGGIGFAFLFERMDDTVKEPDELERQLGIPVLGLIPAEQIARAQLAQGMSLAVAAQQNPRSAFAEAYRSVRTALQFATSEGVPKRLLVTSAAAGEGKSTTALSLAIQFAQAGKNVLLIDADLRNPSLHRALHIDGGIGLTNYLAGAAKPADIAKPTAIANLFLILAGHLPPNPAELLASAKMLSLLSLSAEKFDQVILDCAPVLGLADALILGNLAQACILVVEAGATRRGFVQGAMKRLRSARTYVIGGVLTKIDSRLHAYGYHQSYYYYHHASADAGKQLTT
ncbi:MAG: polysaccharide biosynthesis tyrosine autokinase [Gammaproteobacteria bacterium]